MKIYYNQWKSMKIQVYAAMASQPRNSSTERWVLEASNIGFYYWSSAAEAAEAAACKYTEIHAKPKQYICNFYKFAS